VRNLRSREGQLSETTPKSEAGVLEPSQRSRGIRKRFHADVFFEGSENVGNEVLGWAGDPECSKDESVGRVELVAFHFLRDGQGVVFVEVAETCVQRILETVHVGVGNAPSPKGVNEVLFRKPLSGLRSDKGVPRVEQDALDLFHYRSLTMLPVTIRPASAQR